MELKFILNPYVCLTKGTTPTFWGGAFSDHQAYKSSPCYHCEFAAKINCLAFWLLHACASTDGARMARPWFVSCILAAARKVWAFIEKKGRLRPSGACSKVRGLPLGEFVKGLCLVNSSSCHPQLMAVGAGLWRASAGSLGWLAAPSPSTTKDDMR